jgi:hypothetical protein
MKYVPTRQFARPRPQPRKIDRQAGSHFDKNGRVKTGYLSRDSATAVAQKVARHHDDPQPKAYQCHQCGLWHIGKSNRRREGANLA